MTFPEMVGLLLSVLLIGGLIWGLRILRQPRVAEEQERAARMHAAQTRATERDAVMDDLDDAADTQVADFIRALGALWARRSETCPYCHAHVDAMQQIGRCVYAQPCGCRLGQAHVPEAWR
jgi:hypothetical protein